MDDRHWKFYPALRIALAIAGGIVTAHYTRTTPDLALPVLAFALAWLALAVRLQARVAVPLALCFFCVGVLRYGTAVRPEAELFAGVAVREAEILGVVERDPVIRSGSVELVIGVDSLMFRNAIVHGRSRALVRVDDPRPFDPALLPRVGDRVSIVGLARMPGEAAYPGGIDSRSYMRAQRVDYSFFVGRAASIHVMGSVGRDVVPSLLDDVRATVRDFADRCIGGSESGIARALLLGERDAIDPEEAAAYARTGTVHLLSVSGLHVGVLALALFVVVSWLPNRRAQLVLFVVLLAPYVVLTGGAAPIVRAAAMSTSLMAARVFGRIGRPLNALGLAALVILMVDPAELFDVGFQLSFASVLGLILFYPPIDRFLAAIGGVSVWAGLARGVAHLAALGLAAQLATLPLTLHHFGMFSIVGLVVNVIVVPMYSIALGAAAAGALVAAIVPLPASWFGGAAYLVLSSADGIVQWSASLPWASLQGLTIGTASALALGAGLTALAVAKTGRHAAIRSASLLMLLFSVLLWERVVQPLHDTSAAMLYLTGSGRGAVAAICRGDSVLVVAADTVPHASGHRALLSAIGRYRSIRSVRIIAIDTVKPRNDNGWFVITDHPRELALADPPVIIASSGTCALTLMRLGDAAILRLPLRARRDRALLLQWDGDWTLVDG